MKQNPQRVAPTRARQAVKKTKSTKKGKSTRKANLERRWHQIVNGMGQANSRSPVFVKVNGKITKYRPGKVPEDILNGYVKGAEVFPPQDFQTDYPEDCYCINGFGPLRF